VIGLAVWVTLPDGQRLRAGQTVCDPESGEGAFVYAPEFLAHPQAFALDPVELPLGPGQAVYRREAGVALCFSDALPDDWGRRLLVRRARLPRHEQTAAHLLRALGSSGLGALSFSTEGSPLPPDPTPGLPELERLVEAAQRLEQGLALEDPDLALLLRAGSSAGGARPKALVFDGPVPAIAKFPRPGDFHPIVALEASTMALARRAGLNVPHTHLVTCGRHQALLVHRFDVTPAGGRRHMLSFQTLLQAQGWYQLGYADLFAVLRRLSARPEEDLAALFRQAAFNAAVGNIDDHLKNFTLLHDEHGWRLSPAYDLVPGTSGEVEHVLRYATGHVCPSGRELIAFGHRLGVPAPAEILEEVLEALPAYPEELAAAGVPQPLIAVLAAQVQGHRELLGA
jgi:serine/threonine-protein kinase HipA